MQCHETSYLRFRCIPAFSCRDIGLETPPCLPWALHKRSSSPMALHGQSGSLAGETAWIQVKLECGKLMLGYALPLCACICLRPGSLLLSLPLRKVPDNEHASTTHLQKELSAELSHGCCSGSLFLGSSSAIRPMGAPGSHGVQWTRLQTVCVWVHGQSS